MRDMNILIVDDEPINRFLLLHMLEEEGYKHCYEAQNGREAIELANKINPDLLLLDINMPEIDGLEVARQLKAKHSMHLPIIFITSSDDRKTMLMCLEVGGDDFVGKPFDRAILAAKIDSHLRSRKMSLYIEEQNAQLSAYRTEVELEHSMVEHMYNHALKNPADVLAYFDAVQTPAKTFNGDLFLVNSHPCGGLYFFIGDFTGHGLASTVGAMPVSKTFTAMTAKGLSIIEIAQALNDLLYTFLPVDRFCAATLGYIENSGKRIMLWQGGMPDGFLQRKESNSVQRLSSKHMSLGILSADDFETDCAILDLEHGDSLTFFTDGIVEACPEKVFTEDLSAAMLGEETLQQWVENEPNISAKSLIFKTQEYVRRTQFDDDVTLVRFTSRDLNNLKSVSEDFSLPFSFSVTITPDEMRKEDSLDQIFRIINNQPGLASVRADLFTVLSEIYTNALEHGVLQLDSDLKNSPDGFMEYYERREDKLINLSEGWIKIDIDILSKQRRLALTVQDSGDGFNHASVYNADNETSAGRGIALLSELCDTLRFEDAGNCVVAELII